MIIDSHLHIWSRNRETYPWATDRPELHGLDASAEHLLALMDEAGVQGALVVQPILYRFDHRYVSEWLQREPARFVGMCLANPADPEAPNEMERLVREEGYRGVRLNPNLYPKGVGLDSAISDRLLEKAESLDIAVGFLVQPQHFAAVDALLERHPGVKAIVDHFGHCHTRNGVENNPDFSYLLGMARHPRLSVKISEWPRVSSQEWPYRDVHSWLFRLLDAYGPHRLMWGTDFPFILRQCGYRRGLTLLSEEVPGIASEEMEWLLGKTAQSVFGGWGA